MKKIFLTLLCIAASISSMLATDIRTHFIFNPTLDENADCWTLTSMNHMTTSFHNGDAYIDHFVETWTWDNNGFGAGRRTATQNVLLPKGKYRLECDAMATNQSNASLAVDGVSLFATIGANTSQTTVRTADGAPEHYSLEFTTEATGLVTLGFGVLESTNASWIAADNFKLTLLDATAYTLMDAVSITGDAVVNITNDANNPWMTYDKEKVYATNWTGGSKSTLTLDVTINEDYTFSFDYDMPRNDSWWNYTYAYVNGKQELNEYSSWDGRSGSFTYNLPAGSHQLSIQYKNEYYAHNMNLSNISLKKMSANVKTIVLSQAGDLGLEALSIANNVTDIEYLKITGPMNSADWSTISMMTNLVYLDMTEAQVTDIPNNAFNKNNKLVVYKCPSSLISVGSSAFRYTQLTSIDLPETVTSIGESAFNDLDKLVYAYIPASVTTIPNYCFYDCDRLTEIRGCENVTNVNYMAFYNCNVLKSVDKLTPIIVGDYAFYGCYALQQIDLAKATQIKSYAFEYCNALTSVNLTSITTMGTYCFYSCENLKEVIIGAGISKLSSDCFFNCPISKIYIGCPSAPDRYNTSNNPFYWNGTLYTTATIYVPAYAMTSYKLHEYWSQFTNYEENPLTISDITINGELTLTSNTRIPDTPNITVNYNSNDYTNGRLTINGEMAQAFGTYKQFNNDSKNYNATLITRCPNVTSTSTEVVYHMDYSSYNYWYYITLPFDVKVSDITCSGNAAISICRYDGAARAENGAGSSWVRLDENDILKAGYGYIFCVSDHTDVTLPATAETHNGIFNANAITTSLEDNASVVPSDAGWNLVGNCYPAYYDIYYMDYTAPITVWNTNNRTFTAYSVADDELALSPFQAFFVQKPSGIDNLVLNPQGRMATSAIQKKAAAPAKTKTTTNRRIIDLVLNGTNSEDRTRIVVNPAVSDGFEAETDASKMMSYEAPQLFSVRGEERYAINEGPQQDGLVELSMWLPEDGRYTISISRANAEVTLLDNGMEVEMPYEFHAEQGDVESRFMLRINNDTDALDKVMAEDNKTSRSEIYDLQGRRVNGNNRGIYIINNNKIVK